jgi:hypothetical protein
MHPLCPDRAPSRSFEMPVPRLSPGISAENYRLADYDRKRPTLH